MPGPLIAAGAARAGAAISGRAIAGVRSLLTIDTKVVGQQAVVGLWNLFWRFQNQLQNLGITIIFVDRAIMALKRGWDSFNDAIGASRVSQLALDFSRHADYYGMSVESFQALVLMGQDFGATVNDITDYLSTMEQKIGDLATSKSLQQALKGSGLTSKSFEGLDAMERMFKLQEALSKLPTAQKVRATGIMLGDDLSRKIGPMGGIDAMLKHMKEMMGLGAVMTKEQIESAKAFARQNERLGATVTGLGNNVAAIFIPALTRLAKAFEWLFGGISRYIQTNSTQWGKSLEIAMDRVLGIFTRIGDAIARFMPLDQFAKQLVDGVVMATLLLTIFTSMTLLLKGSAAFKALFYAALWAESFYVYLRGGKSVVGEMINKSSALQNMMAAFGILKWVVGWLINASARLVGFLVKSEMVRDLISLIAIAFSGLAVGPLAAVIDAVTIFLYILDMIWVTIKSIVSLGANAFGLGWLGRLMIGQGVDEAANNSTSAMLHDLKSLGGLIHNPTSSDYLHGSMGDAAWYAFNPKPNAAAPAVVTNHFTINAQGVDPQVTMQSALEQSAAMARGTIPGRTK